MASFDFRSRNYLDTNIKTFTWEKKSIYILIDVIYVIDVIDATGSIVIDKEESI
jgi:hypothetical protein